MQKAPPRARSPWGSPCARPSHHAIECRLLSSEHGRRIARCGDERRVAPRRGTTVTSATALRFFAAFALVFVAASAHAADKKPNILFIVSDDTGYGDLGPYGGGVGR